MCLGRQPEVATPVDRGLRATIAGISAFQIFMQINSLNVVLTYFLPFQKGRKMSHTNLETLGTNSFSCKEHRAASWSLFVAGTESVTCVQFKNWLEGFGVVAIYTILFYGINLVL